MSNRPEWQLRSLRRIQLRIMWLLVAACSLTIAVAWLSPYVFDSKPINGGLFAGLPILLVLIFGVNMAYFRGVDDGQAHPKSRDTPKDI
jgi:hypothetical protein